MYNLNQSVQNKLLTQMNENELLLTHFNIADSQLVQASQLRLLIYR